MEKIKILIVDDHPMLRGGVHSLLKKQEDMEVVGEAESGASAIQLIPTLDIQLIVMDVNLNGSIDIRSTEDIKQRWPSIKVVAFSMHNEAQVVRRMLKAGASAYLTKSAPHGELIRAIRAVMNNEVYYDSQILEVMTSTPNGDADNVDFNLSIRENEVLFFVAKEFTNQEIADRMEISLRTVETHKRNLIKKLRVKNVVGLVRFAMDNGHLFQQ